MGHYLAFDLGAESGRAISGTLHEGTLLGSSPKAAIGRRLNTESCWQVCGSGTLRGRHGSESRPEASERLGLL